MARTLQWDQIQAPNTGSALAGISSANAEMRSAFRDLGNVFSDMTKRERDAQTNALMTRVAMAQDLEGIAALRAGLDPNNRMVRASDVASALNNRAGAIREDRAKDFQWEGDVALRDNAAMDIGALIASRQTGEANVNQHAGAYRLLPHYLSQSGAYIGDKHNSDTLAETGRANRAREAGAAADRALRGRQLAREEQKDARSQLLFQKARDTLASLAPNLPAAELSNEVQRLMGKDINSQADLAAVLAGIGFAQPVHTQANSAELKAAGLSNMGTIAEAANREAELGQSAARQAYLANNPAAQTFIGADAFKGMSDVEMGEAVGKALGMNGPEALSMIQGQMGQFPGLSQQEVAANLVQSVRPDTSARNALLTLGGPIMWAYAGLKSSTGYDPLGADKFVQNRLNEDVLRERSGSVRATAQRGGRAAIEADLAAAEAPYAAAIQNMGQQQQMATQYARAGQMENAQAALAQLEASTARVAQMRQAATLRQQLTSGQLTPAQQRAVRKQLEELGANAGTIPR